MMIDGRCLLLLIWMFGEGNCRDSWEQKYFDKTVLRAACDLKCPDNPCNADCIKTGEKIKELDEEAEAGARIICRDERYAVLAHNPGLFVIEHWYSTGASNFSFSQISNGTKTRVPFAPRFLGETRNHWLLYRVSSKGISRPEATILESGTQHSRTVTNITVEVAEIDMPSVPLWWRAEIGFMPSEFRHCYYRVTCRQDDGDYVDTDKLEETENLSVTFVNLPPGGKFTVEVRPLLEEESRKVSSNIGVTTKKFRTPRCERDTFYCVPESVKGLNATVTHRGENVFDVSVTWDQVEEYFSLPNEYSIEIIPDGAETRGRRFESVDRGNTAVFHGVKISELYDVYIKASTLAGDGPQVSKRFTIPPEFNRPKAPPAVEGLNASASHKTGNTFDIIVTWDLPEFDSDFYIVGIVSNSLEINDSVYQNISGSTPETIFTDVEISEQFVVSIQAWASAQGGPVRSQRFRRPDVPIHRTDNLMALYVTCPILGVIITAGIAVYGYFRVRKGRLGQRIQLDGYEMSVNRLSITRVLGTGAFGVVKHGILSDDQGNKTTVAVKMIREESNPNDLRNFRNEIKFMKTLDKHRNIVSMLGCCSIGPYPFLVVEYCSRGDLHSFLRQSLLDSAELVDETKKRTVSSRNFRKRREICPENSGSLATSQGNENYIRVSSLIEAQDFHYNDNVITVLDMLNFGRQIATGMEFLSSTKIVHRDLAARNILVCDNWTVKISDFGLSRDVYQENIYRKCGIGLMPIKWMAIESLTHRVYSTSSDVWSFGVLLWEILTFGGDPYPGIPTLEILKHLQSGNRLERPENCSIPLYNVMLSCWRTRAKDRPTFTVLCLELDKLIGVDAENKYLDLCDVSEGTPPDAEESGNSCSRPTSHPIEMKTPNDLELEIIVKDQGQASNEAGQNSQAI